MRKHLMAGNRSATFLLMHVLSSLAFFTVVHRRSFFTSSNGPDHLIVHEYDTIAALHFNTLRLIILQKNADTWFQPSSLQHYWNQASRIKFSFPDFLHGIKNIRLVHEAKFHTPTNLSRIIISP